MNDGGRVAMEAFGRSPRPPTGYSADAHTDAVAAVLRQHGAAEPIVVGTHSVGSVVALRHPDLVASITAFAPPLYASRHDAEAGISGTDPLARLFLFSEELSERACALMCEHRDAATVVVRAAPPSLPQELARDRVGHSWSSYSETLSNLVFTSEASGWLDPIDVPVQLIAGDLDDALDLHWLEALERAHPKVALLVVTRRWARPAPHAWRRLPRRTETSTDGTCRHQRRRWDGDRLVSTGYLSYDPLVNIDLGPLSVSPQGIMTAVGVLVGARLLTPATSNACTAPVGTSTARAELGAPRKGRRTGREGSGNIAALR